MDWRFERRLGGYIPVSGVERLIEMTVGEVGCGSGQYCVDAEPGVGAAFWRAVSAMLPP